MKFRASKWLSSSHLNALNTTCRWTRQQTNNFWQTKWVLNKRTTQNCSWLSIRCSCQPFGFLVINSNARQDANRLQMAYCTAKMSTKICQIELSFRTPHVPGQRFSDAGLETGFRSSGQTRQYSCQNRAFYQTISSHSRLASHMLLNIRH